MTLFNFSVQLQIDPMRFKEKMKFREIKTKGCRKKEICMNRSKGNTFTDRFVIRQLLAERFVRPLLHRLKSQSLRHNPRQWMSWALSRGLDLSHQSINNILMSPLCLLVFLCIFMSANAESVQLPLQAN